MQERLTWAEIGKTGWFMVFLLPSKRVVWYACNAVEATIFAMDVADGLVQVDTGLPEPVQADLFGEVV